MKQLLISLTLVCLSVVVFAQRNIDVLHYEYGIELNDKNDSIHGSAIIKFAVKEDIPAISFDLSKAINGKGMQVYIVLGNKHNMIKFGYTQDHDKLIINKNYNKGDTAELLIFYEGIPADGLIISKNKYGHRTFFSDNWPNRAHNWIPCVDDPADKASVEFIITAPAHYQVVSNGVLVEESNLPDNKKLTHWKEDVPLPTKVMVIGVADFAVNYLGDINCVPVSSWVFPENKKNGFNDYAQAKDILSFFMNYIGAYPYKKLANVQSKTIFGGMENAGAIFYFENSVTGEANDESLLAHEIVHQWFGDMATEKSFAHLWLSEGFATYLTHFFIESKYGTDSLNNEMKKERNEIIDFAKESNRSIVDSISPLMSLLNVNSYQKGGWVLHMLRRQLGDSVFHKIIRGYYAAYAGKNADTRDFEKICEKESGKDLKTFFDQWLYTQGLPKLNVQWKYDVKSKNVLLTVTQLQKDIFQFPLDIKLQTASGKTQWETVSVTKQSQPFSIAVKDKPVQVFLDPKTSLLFEGSVSPVN
jgi:aminopeptidase N